MTIVSLALAHANSRVEIQQLKAGDIAKAASRVKKIRNSYGVVLTVFTVAVSEGAVATKNL